MTNAEFIRLLSKAQKSYPYLTREGMKRLKRIYIKATEDVIAIIKKAEMAGNAKITIESWRQIQIQLEKSAQLIQEAIETQAPLIARKAMAKLGKINTEYIMDAVKRAGSEKITQIGVDNMFMAINERVAKSIVNRVYLGGYTFSQSVWRAGQYYQMQIKNVISAGLAQGRDIIKIAKDIQIYTADGKIALVKRFGPGLIRGSKAFINRIGNRIDYRALRLIRSEMNMSLQDAGKEQGRINPACTQLWDWVRGGSQHWNCICPELAANSPYEYNAVPGYPHPNCICQVRPRLMNHTEFINDLLSWTNGQQVPYLDNWYNNIYQYYK